jgi:DNA primase
MDDVKEEIRARLPIEDVVGRYVQLKRAGKNLKGLSPWTNEKTPSFMVSPEKGIWHDYSANKGGDIFAFLMEVEGLGFREAMEKLAGWAGVEIKKYEGDGRRAALKKRASEANELACKFFQICLVKNPKIAEYVFYRRNLNKRTVEQFRVGYAPKGGRVLVDLLKRKGFADEELKEAGLVNRFGGDLFRERMTVPLMDAMGSVIGFTARIVDDKLKDAPKYLNTNETILYTKSRHIFGLSQAKEAIRKNGFAVVVEGNMDVISSHQAGVHEAVATGGTAMTENHLKELARRTNDIRLAYDGDKAGVAAAERAIMMAGGMGISLSIISDYDGAKDPDELIQRGPELWQRAVEQAVPAMDWLLGKYEERCDMKSARGKREFSDMAVTMLGFVKDPVEYEHYEQVVAGRLGVSVEALRNKELLSAAPSDAALPGHDREPARRYAGRPLSRSNLPSQTGESQPETAPEGLESNSDTQMTRLTPMEERLVAIAVGNDGLRGGVADGDFVSGTGVELARRGFDIDKTEGNLYNVAERMRLLYEGRYADWADNELQQEIEYLRAEIKKTKIAKQKEILSKELSDAELMGDEAAVMDLLGRIDQLNRS